MEVVTVGTNMKTDLREPAHRCESVHAEVFIAALSTRSMVTKQDIWSDCIWIGNDALCKSPENPE